MIKYKSHSLNKKMEGIMAQKIKIGYKKQLYTENGMAVRYNGQEVYQCDDPNMWKNGSGQYISDLISWGAIGARTTESQVHRELASALSCPVGFKNGTDGNVKIALDAIQAASVPHVLYSPDKSGQMCIYQTHGNPFSHVILRGGKVPNYHSEDIKHTCEQLDKAGLQQSIMIDCSHGNSYKDHNKQIDVARSLAEQITQGEQSIFGVMIESFIVPGNQAVKADTPLTYGQSITDACIDLTVSEEILSLLADAVKSR